MKKLLDFLSFLALLISSLCVVVMTSIITYQVVARYVYNASPAWSERLALVLLAYLVFFGTAVGVRQQFHIRIDALRNAMPKPIMQFLVMVSHLAVAAAGVVMVFAGIQLVTTLWEFAVPALGIPRGLALMPIPVAGALITIFSIANLFDAPPSTLDGAE